MDYKKIVLHLVIVGIVFVSVTSMVTAEIVGLGTGKVQTSFAAFLSGPSTTMLADFLSGPVIMNNLAPIITSISPTSARINDAPFVFIVDGSNFADGYKIVIGDTGYGGSTLYNSPNQLELSALDPSILTLGQHNVFVRPPAGSQAGDSSSVVFNVYNPIPNPTSISPSSIAVGYGGGFFDVRGTNFVDGSVVNFNNQARITTYFTPTHLQVILTAADHATAGTFNITVTNPSTATIPNPVTALTFTVTPVAPNVMQPLP